MQKCSMRICGKFMFAFNLFYLDIPRVYLPAKTTIGAFHALVIKWVHCALKCGDFTAHILFDPAIRDIEYLSEFAVQSAKTFCWPKVKKLAPRDEELWR